MCLLQHSLANGRMGASVVANRPINTPNRQPFPDAFQRHAPFDAALLCNSLYGKPQPDTSMSADRDGDLLIAVALTRFSVQFEDADPELSERAWQLATFEITRV